MALLGALGGAEPTGLAWLDPGLLGLAGAAIAACAVRARTVPVYLMAASAAVLQPAVGPLAVGVVGLVATFAGRVRVPRPTVVALGGGLAWAAAVGAPFEAPARWVAVPALAAVGVVRSARSAGSRRFRRRLDRVATVVAGTALVCAGLGAVSIVTARSHLDRGQALLRSGLDSARGGDTDAAVLDLGRAQRALARGEASLGAPWARPAWLLPGVSQNARALHRAVTEIGDVAAAGVTAARDADLTSLRARGGRIDLAAVAAMEEPLVRVIAQLRRSETAVRELGEGWLLPPVADRIDELHAELADAVPSTELALEGVRVAPSLLGGDGPRRYLVLFTTPVEARARTGFPGNFAEVTLTDGRFEMTRFGRITELNGAGAGLDRVLTAPPDYLARYGRFDPAREWRNITLSPDFPTVASVAASLYPQSGGAPVDGVMSVDPVALAALLTFTGPIAVPEVGAPLTARNAAEFLLRDQYLELPDVPDRVDALEHLAETAFDRLTEVDLPGPRRLGHVLGPVAAEHHLQMATFDDRSMRFLDRLGISGRYPDVDGDFVGVTTSNAAGNKLDLFLRRSLDYDVRWNPTDGELTATATVTLTNEAPAAGLPPYVISNALGQRPLEAALPDGWSNTFVTIYTPWELRAAALDGDPLDLERVDELGRRALATFVPIAPGATRVLTVELVGHLPALAYHLDLAAQPLVEPEDVTIRVELPGVRRLRTTGPLRAVDTAAVGRFELRRDRYLTVAPR